MSKSILVRAALVAALFMSGVAAGMYVQLGTDSPQRVEQKRTDLSGAPGMEVIVSIAEYKPGETIGLHSHHGVETAYVIQGANIEVQGKGPMTFQTGDTLMNLRDVQHAGFKVVGPTSLKLFTVHIVDKGKPLYEFAAE